jgi:hypothetical protein
MFRLLWESIPLGVVLILWFFPIAIAGGGIIPVSKPDTDIAYINLREMYLRGLLNNPIGLFSPLDYRDLDLNDVTPEYERIVTPVKALIAPYKSNNGELHLRGSLLPHGLYNDDDRHTYMAASLMMNYQISDNWIVETSYFIDGGLVDDSLYAGKKWDNSAGYADLAVVGYRGSKLKLDIGRRRNVWGVARSGHSLMLSSVSMPMDGIFLDYTFNRYLSFHSISARLSPLAQDVSFADSGLTENRYFSAHALRISPFDWWNIVLKESIIYGGAGRDPELAYVFPLIWYHAEQLNSNIDDNTFFGLETVIRYRNRYAAYLELLLDDYQIENQTESDKEPAEYGLIIGADLFDWPLKSGAFEAEYTKVKNYTYNQMKPRNVYINQHYPIGHPLGPDHKRLRLSYTYHINKRLIAAVEGFLINNGQGYLNADWDMPWIDNPDYHEKFPSGVVEKTRGGRLDVIFVKNEWLGGKMSFDAADIQNDGNVRDVDRTYWNINMQIILNLPGFSWRDKDD